MGFEFLLIISTCLSIIILVYSMYILSNRAKKSKSLTSRIDFWLSNKSTQVRIADMKKSNDDTIEDGESFIQRVIIPVVEEVGKWVTNKVSFAQLSNVKKQLSAAGYRDKNAVSVFFATKVTTSVSLLILSVLFVLVVMQDPSRLPLTALGSVVVGFILPQLVLDSLAAKRRENIDRILPDALDLLVICSEAGLGIDQCLLRVGNNLGSAGKDLAEEISLTNKEMNLGQDRTLCWENFGERSGSEELKNLARIIHQSEKVGASIGEVLRKQSDYMRVKRRQKAEQTAAKMGVKIMVPTVIFIFPTVLIVTFGPFVSQLMKAFSGGGGL